MLALRPNQPVSREWLAAGLWPGTGPRSAGANIRSYVAELRRLLAGGSPGGPRIEHAAQRYTLVVSETGLDALKFEDDAVEGRHLLAEGRYSLAAERLGRATELWRGPVLEGVTVPHSVSGPVRVLEDRRLEAIEDSVEARLHLGRHAELVVELSGLTATHVLRERLWRQRMLALYRCGRRAEALAVYAELSRLLDVDLGVTPSAETRLLHRQLQGDRFSRGR